MGGPSIRASQALDKLSQLELMHALIQLQRVLATIGLWNEALIHLL